MKADPGLLDDLVKRILTVVSPVKIILFGSAGRDEMAASSDLDILVVIPEDSDRKSISRGIYRALIGYQLAVDVIVATEDDLHRYGDNFSLIYYSALHEGRQIYAA